MKANNAAYRGDQLALDPIIELTYSISIRAAPAFSPPMPPCLLEGFS